MRLEPGPSALLSTSCLISCQTRWHRYAAFGVPPVILGTMFPFTSFGPGGPSHPPAPTWDPLPPANATGTYIFIGEFETLQEQLTPHAMGIFRKAVGLGVESHVCM